MGLRFKDQNLCDCYFVTTTFAEWEKLGEIEGVYDVIADSLKFYSLKYNAKIVGFVFMPSHIHFLVIIDGDKLSHFMRDFKKYTSQKSIKELCVAQDQIWKSRYDRVAVYTENLFRTKLDYIHKNPVRAKLVSNMEDWKWSSYRNYIGESIEIVPVWKDWMW